ncbi:hypothetical protein FGX02_01040, partial [Xylella fastidiosa subsp. multiplex]|uniref:hypothetical protein n=1 Tax=Xylella fastidiosa TaxID=2371 RepID=UPI0012AE1238
MNRDRAGRRSEQASYAKAAPLAGGVGWNLGASHADGARAYQQADVNWRTQQFDLRGAIHGDDRSAPLRPLREVVARAIHAAA